MSTQPRKPRRPRPRKITRRKNTKVTGERSEAAFLNRAAGLGFGVAKPWGDSLRYDFILDNGSGRLHRVQVKCTESMRAQAYETRATYTVGKGRAVYTKSDIDFIAAHVVPLDIWYIIPVEVCAPAPMLRFYPHRQAKKMRLEPYREAWHLLQSDAQEKRGLEIQASADESVYPDETHVGTAALGCSPSQSPDAVKGFSNLTWLTPRPTRFVTPKRGETMRDSPSREGHDFQSCQRRLRTHTASSAESASASMRRGA